MKAWLGIVMVLFFLLACGSSGGGADVAVAPGESLPLAPDRYLFCRRAVGQCHDVPDSDLREMDILGVVATQTGSDQSADFSISTTHFENPLKKKRQN